MLFTFGVRVVAPRSNAVANFTPGRRVTVKSEEAKPEQGLMCVPPSEGNEEQGGGLR